MGFRFQKRVKILPGVKLNVSKSGISTSVGGPGASVNLRKGRAKATVGLPGSGLSYSGEISGKRDRAGRDPSSHGAPIPAMHDRRPSVIRAFFRGLGVVGTVGLAAIVTGLAIFLLR